MADAGYNFREVRIVIEDDLTHCYVFLEALGDCPIGVQGWHYKAYPASYNRDNFWTELVHALEWPLEAPKGWGEHH